MKICLITPARPGSRSGNRNTAQRWAQLLRHDGHKVQVQTEWDAARADLMIALHARRSYSSIKAFAAAHPRVPLVVTLTGTDLYRDIHSDADAQHSLKLATQLIVLQALGLDELDRETRAKTLVVMQSARPVKRQRPLRTCFEVCVLGHLRAEKDPFRCAEASTHLPPDSRIRVVHCGKALSEEMQAQARDWMKRSPRYRWFGERPHAQVRRVLARARLMVISSRMEGGANVVSEALAAGCPVLASRVPGNIGMLGRDYAGYYDLGDAAQLAALLQRAEDDPEFYRRLRRQCQARRKLVSPAAELRALRAVVRAAKRAATAHGV